jgi:acetyl-CoA carboxylase biotin carboxyl carrier protein
MQWEICMDLRKLKTLIDLVSDSGIAELEITEGEGKVRIVKFSQSAQPVAPLAQAQAAAVAPVSAPADAPASPAAPDGHMVKAPMVGTFYRAASPDGSPFVDVGKTVTEETVVCIIEAMKVMNEIKAETSGVIAEVVAENGKPVQFGHVLFKVR